MNKKIVGVGLAIVILAGGIFYFTRSKPQQPSSLPANPDLGTKGGATQVNMETH